LATTLRTSMKTLDICVFTITNDKLSQAILECQDRGVKIRIITDDVKSNELGSDIEKFWNAVSLFFFKLLITLISKLIILIHFIFHFKLTFFLILFLI